MRDLGENAFAASIGGWTLQLNKACRGRLLHETNQDFKPLLKDDGGQ